MLKKALRKFFSLEGVLTVLIIATDGRVIEGLGPVVIDREQLAAVVAFVMAESRAMATRLGHEHLSSVFVEFEDRTLVSVPLKEDLFLVVIARPPANIGKISYELRKNHAAILELL